MCVFGERGRVYREIERERHREMESVCREREGVCFEIEEVCREIESACKGERERERGESVQRERERERERWKVCAERRKECLLK